MGNGEHSEQRDEPFGAFVRRIAPEHADYILTVIEVREDEIARLTKQLQGAVGEIEALRHWIDVAARNCPANGEVDAILVESRRRVPPAGGQYGAASPNKQNDQEAKP